MSVDRILRASLLPGLAAGSDRHHAAMPSSGRLPPERRMLVEHDSTLKENFARSASCPIEHDRPFASVGDDIESVDDVGRQWRIGEGHTFHDVVGTGVT